MPSRCIAVAVFVECAFEISDAIQSDLTRVMFIRVQLKRKQQQQKIKHVRYTQGHRLSSLHTYTFILSLYFWPTQCLSAVCVVWKSFFFFVFSIFVVSFCFHSHHYFSLVFIRNYLLWNWIFRLTLTCRRHRRCRRRRHTYAYAYICAKSNCTVDPRLLFIFSSFGIVYIGSIF